MIKNLPETDDYQEQIGYLFHLFGNYGNVHKIKILYKNRSNVLIEFEDPEQANMAKRELMGIPFFNQKLIVAYSKVQQIQNMQEQNLDQTQKMLCQDYSNSNEHRFRHPGSKNFQNVSKPSPILHISNLSKDVNLEAVLELMAEFKDLQDVKVINHRIFSIESPENSSIKIMMLLEFQELAQAVRALCVLHNQELHHKKIKISFAKSTIKNSSTNASQDTKIHGLSQDSAKLDPKK